MKRMPCLEEVRIASLRRKTPTDENPQRPQENAGVDKNSEMDVIDEAGGHEDLVEGEASFRENRLIESFRRHDDVDVSSDLRSRSMSRSKQT